MRQETGRYEDTYLRPRRFSFGKNWQSYLKKLDAERVEKARNSLRRLACVRGKNFLDIGCGSGIFSLVAFLEGARRVVSVDVDKHSLACARQLRRRAGNPLSWSVRHGSILDEKFVQILGEHDVVYSWGVLHHTGDMRLAFAHVGRLVKKGGLLCISIYNNNEKYRLEGSSLLWGRLKRWYNHRGALGKGLIYYPYICYLFAGLLLHGRNPVRYVKEFPKKRGMDFFSDVRDWLGGYPYEYASVAEVKGYFVRRGFRLERVNPARSLGCNEFVFRKRRSRDRQKRSAEGD